MSVPKYAITSFTSLTMVWLSALFLTFFWEIKAHARVLLVEPNTPTLLFEISLMMILMFLGFMSFLYAIEDLRNSWR